MNDDRLFLRVGGIVLCGLAFAVVAIVALGGRHLVPGFRVYVEMDRSGPIHEGTPVKLAGRTIGEVQRVGTRNGGVTLDLWIRRRWRPHVHARSVIFVNQQNVFGEAYLEIGPPDAGDPGPVLEDGAVVRGIDPPQLDRLLFKSYQNLEAFSALLHEGVPEVDELIRALDELERTVAVVEPAPGAYGRTWAAGVRFFDEAARLREGLEGSGASPAGVRGTIGRARALVGRTRRDLGTTAERLGHVADELARLQASVGEERVARVGQAIDQARRLIGEIERLIGEGEAVAAALERGEGTVGALLHDQEIADDLKQLMKVVKTRPWTTVGHPQ